MYLYSNKREMAKIKIYHNNSCSKSRATLELLKDQNLDLEIQEYLTNIPSRSELKEILAMLNFKPMDLLRKNETLFKEKFSQLELSDEKWIDILLENPILIERPIVIKDGKAVIGRPIKQVIDLIK